MVFEKQNRWEGMLARSDGGVDFWHNGIVRILLAAAILPIVVAFGLIVFFIHPNGMPLVLHYNVYFGVDLLGVWWQAYAFPVLGIFFLVLHAFLAKRFYEGMERIACYLLLLSAWMLASGIFIASIGIALINY